MDTKGSTVDASGNTQQSLVARYAERFPALSFLSSEAGMLEIILSKPGRLNAADRRMHRQLADVWLTIDQDPEVDVVIVRGEGGAFSAEAQLSVERGRALFQFGRRVDLETLFAHLATPFSRLALGQPRERR